MLVCVEAAGLLAVALVAAGWEGGWVVGVQMVYGESRQNSSRVVVVGGGGGAFMIVSSFLPGF